MLEFTSNCPPKILASLHQLDFAPYVSGSYNAQWNAPELPYNKHMSRWGCIIWEIEVKGVFAGIMATIALFSRYGSKLAYDIKIGVNSTSFFSGKFLPCLVF